MNHRMTQAANAMSRIMTIEQLKALYSTTDVATVRLGGRHGLRVEHFEIDGFATLMLRIVPDSGKLDRGSSGGSGEVSER